MSRSGWPTCSAGGGVTLSVASELFGGQPFTPANPIRVAFGAQVVKVVEQEPRALGIAQLGLTRSTSFRS